MGRISKKARKEEKKSNTIIVHVIWEGLKIILKIRERKLKKR